MSEEKTEIKENTGIENTNSTNLVEIKPNGKHLFQKGHKKMGGKKKGKKNKATIEKEIIEQEFKNRILSQVQDLLTAQLNIAKGTSYLYKIVTHKSVKGGEGRREHILVTDPYEIKDFLDELEGEDGVNPNTDNEDYYYISTKQPDNRALDSLINRVFGKPKETLDVNIEEKQIRELVLTTRQILELKPNGNEQSSQSENK